MKIKRIDYNWSPGGVSSREEFGDEYYTFEVGKQFVNRKEIIVRSIEEHCPAGEGDKWFYDVTLSDGSMQRIFNVNKVYFDKD